MNWTKITYIALYEELLVGVYSAETGKRCLEVEKIVAIKLNFLDCVPVQ